MIMGNYIVTLEKEVFEKAPYEEVLCEELPPKEFPEPEQPRAVEEQPKAAATRGRKPRQ
jgi:hypothetical protein